MGRPKKITAADIMELSAKRMLRGALGRLGGPERLGELLGDLGDNVNENGMASATPDSIRARALTELARLLGQYGAEGSGSDIVDQEALDAFIAQHEANRPAAEEEEGGPFDDDDPE